MADSTLMLCTYMLVGLRRFTRKTVSCNVIVIKHYYFITIVDCLTL